MKTKDIPHFARGLNLMKKFFENFFNVVLDILYPRHCALCGKTICGITDTALCPRCLSKKHTPKVVRDHKFDFSEAIAVIKYDGHARDAMIKYKFKSIKYYAKAYAHILSNLETERPYLRDALMCSVPVSRTRDRAYSQTVLIAEELSKIWDSKFIPDLLKRCRTVGQLSKMKLYQRRFFIKGSIDLNSFYDVYDKDIVVIDDIFTSGTTANECAKVLKMYGARNVYILCPCYD